MGNAIDDYLAPLPKEQRDALEELRRIVRTVVPEVEETIRTRVPAFRYKGRPLVSMGAAKKHLSLFIMYGKALKTYKDELRGFDTSNTPPTAIRRTWPSLRTASRPGSSRG